GEVLWLAVIGQGASGSWPSENLRRRPPRPSPPAVPRETQPRSRPTPVLRPRQQCAEPIPSSGPPRRPAGRRPVTAAGYPTARSLRRLLVEQALPDDRGQTGGDQRGEGTRPRKQPRPQHSLDQRALGHRR